ncbi:MAG: acetyl-CoA hydrolase/transferase C-terminal domain-containing protein [Candidatus Caldarchaeum sp.]|nr:acetyl-CoA hydrolase/transferase C-terminal domain-containing protein [Candidatus Caldarchaeum sp.]
MSRLPERSVLAFGGMVGTAIVKEIPKALSMIGDNHSFTLLTGGTTTSFFEECISSLNVVRRYPVASGKISRALANKDLVKVVDYWLSEYSRLVRNGGIPQAEKIDVAFVESTGVTEEGIIPSLSLDAAPSFVTAAEKVVVEVNVAKPVLYGLHDVFLPRENEPVTIKDPMDRIGEPVIKCPRDKIIGIIPTDKPESVADAYGGVGRDELLIAENISDLLEKKVGLPVLRKKHTVQPGAGPLASALLKQFGLDGLKVWSEAITVDWVQAIGEKVASISTSCIYALRGQENIMNRIYDELTSLQKNLVLRPYEITNRPEIISQMKLISVQQAIEVDIYGNVNITHIGGDIYNGVGGSGDFSRNAALTVVALPSTTGNGNYSRIVPICSHVDVPEHDVDFVVTEMGWADLRGLSPRERARLIIEKCSHPKFADDLRQYFEEASRTGGHQPVSWRAALAFREKMGQS